jgi:hypothetical protein
MTATTKDKRGGYIAMRIPAARRINPNNINISSNEHIPPPFLALPLRYFVERAGSRLHLKL